MATLKILDSKGKEVGDYEIDPTDFAPHINRQLLHDVIVMYQANLRQGSAKTKSRSEVSATTKKLYRQKGTGNARAGSRVSGVRRGGGHIFAIKPRDYSYRLPRKAVQLANRMAMAAKLKDNRVAIIDQLSFDAPKTKEMATILQAVGCGNRRVLIATASHDVNTYKSARNIEGVSVLPVSDLNALALLKSHIVLFTKDALDGLKERAAKASSKKTAAAAS